MGTRLLTVTKFTHFDPRAHDTNNERNIMRKLYSWNRPEPRIYSYNTDPSTFRVGYSASSSASRSARAASVSMGSESMASRGLRATTVAPASGDSLAGYSGFYGKQLAEAGQRTSSSMTAASKSLSAKTAVSSSTAVTETVAKTIQKTEKTSTKVDMMKEHAQSLEYGKSSRSAALRRAEVHAVKSGNDPRHVMVPHNLEDDICKKVADIHMYDTSRMSREGRVKVERMEKEMSALINSSMAYNSSYAKSAKQMSMEAMAACESEAAASRKKVRKTVVEETRRAVVA